MKRKPLSTIFTAVTLFPQWPIGRHSQTRRNRCVHLSTVDKGLEENPNYAK